MAIRITDPDYEAFCDERLQDPYPFFRRLREEDPVHWCEPMNLWLVTRYDDILAGLRDPRLSSNRMSMYTQALGAAGIAAIVVVVNCSARTTWTTVEMRTNVVKELSRLTSHFSEAAWWASTIVSSSFPQCTRRHQNLERPGHEACGNTRSCTKVPFNVSMN